MFLSKLLSRLQTGQRLRRVGGVLAVLAATCLTTPAIAQGNACPSAQWPLYQDFLQRFVQPDGRVVDFSVPQLHSTSEGQSYGMFFALIARDADTFESLWRWSVGNLAGGDLSSRLPAWQWGKRQDGTWGVLDPNAASDADLWFAYVLLEAGRLWKRDDYIADAHTLLKRVAQDEVVAIPGLGQMLLPAPVGFALPDQLWRLNPSYMPVPVLRRLAAADKQTRWNEIASNTVRMLREASPKGFAADWVGYKSLDGKTGSFVVDTVKGDVGSYDAIRNYMWAGMTPPGDALAKPALNALSGMRAAAQATPLPPEYVQVLTGVARGTGPVGFSAALLPYYEALGQTALRNAQAARVQAAFAPGNANPPPYYDYVLGLFGTGWSEQRYRFLPSGQLQLRWEKACPRATAR
ncbi:cellulase [Pigmentiphaga aceris]|uniref:cellulase n=1 Tax=Pigmentiphaga aceris TaxID=1940612 RepID=A0A5C0AZI8_9BURK|nr:cellulose synthase complex periplasmic endoglucanase BcsZ [Pigmentiphaga aceris]QEI07024.1 cellulase [Pigmentiphaga aceris]